MIMSALPLLLVMVTLAVAPVGSIAQEPTGAPPPTPPPQEAQNTKAPPATTPAQTTTPQTSAQNPTPAATQKAGEEAQPPSIENTSEAEEPMPRRDLVHWNEYQGPHFTIRVGGGFLYDFAAFAQNHESKEQIAMLPGEKVRDSRLDYGRKIPQFQAAHNLVLRAHVRRLRRRLVCAANRDPVWGPQNPELLLHWAPKRGLSNKIMTGYDGWTQEKIHLQRRNHSAAGRRFQVDGLFQKAWLSLELSAASSTMPRPRARRFPRIPARRSDELYGSRYIQRRMARCSTWALTGAMASPWIGQLRERSRPESAITPYFLNSEHLPRAVRIS